MSALIKNNLALIAGIVIPILLVIFLSITMLIIKDNTLPPEYDFIYMDGGYNSQVKVLNNRLELEYLTSENQSFHPKIFIFHVNSKQSEQIKIDFSKPIKLENKTAIYEILNFTDYKLDKSSKSPDGYTFNNNYMSSYPYSIEHPYHYSITKNGKSVMIASDANYLQFIGWIIPNKQSKQ